MSNSCRHRPEGRAYIVKNGVYPCRYCQCPCKPERASWKRMNIITGCLSVAVAVALLFAGIRLTTGRGEGTFGWYAVRIIPIAAIPAVKYLGMYLFSRCCLRYRVEPSAESVDRTEDA